MKQENINHTLSAGGGYWSAMVQSSEDKVHELIEHLGRVRNVQVLADAPVWNFDLIGRRTFTPNYEEYEGMSQEEAILAFEKEFPLGKLISLSENPSDDFSPIQNWSSFSMIGYSFVDSPGMTGAVRVVSEEVKRVLDDCLLPPHHFYPIQLKHEISQEIRSYYVLQLLCDVNWIFENVEWTEVEPFLYDVMASERVKDFTKGTGESYDGFVKNILPVEKTNDFNLLKLNRFVFKQKFDLLPVEMSMGISTNLVEKLRREGLDQAIGQSQLKQEVIIGF